MIRFFSTSIMTPTLDNDSDTLFEGTGFQTEGDAFFGGSLVHETILRKQEEPG